MNGNGTVPMPHDDAERSPIEHDRDVAWELYDAQPTHPGSPKLRRVCSRANPPSPG